MVLIVLTERKNGQIDDAIAPFAAEFIFRDRGIGLEFKDKGRLAEFQHQSPELTERPWVLSGIVHGPERWLSLWPRLRLLHCDLIDMREGFCSRSSFYGLDGDVLDLLLCLGQILFKSRNLSSLVRHSLLQCPNP